MSILCSMFGHRPAFGYGRREGEGYFRQRVGETDGMRAVHVRLFTDCERCGITYQVGMIHALTEKQLRPGGNK